MDSERYARHATFFGEQGQRRLSESSVGLVGLGGLGAHVVQQLAYLGVRRFQLIDDDEVSVSNLNRLVTATSDDVGRAKVDVAARTIEDIQPEAQVTKVARTFLPDSTPPSLAEVDALFGCVDSDVPRMLLTRFASTYALPYIDLATDITPDGVYGGRIVFARDGERCLSCLGELDQHELARAQMSDEQRAADDAIYGVDRAALADGGPSVVSVNGVIASLAVTEFMVWRTGLRHPKGYLTYRGDLAMVSHRPDVERDYCGYCMDLWASGRDDLD